MIISQNSNDVYYAYTRGRFWRWDGSARAWKESHLLAQKFGKAKAAEKRLTPEAFLTGDEFIPMDDYELPDQMLTALREAKPCKNAPIVPVEEPEVPGTQTAQDKPLTTVPDEMRPAFDYSGLDAQTVDALHMAENQYTQGKKMAETGLRWMVNAVAMAHDALCGAVVQQLDNGRFAPKDDTFRAWCASIGVSKSSAYNLLKVAERFGNIQLDGKSILDVQPATLLYEAAKPSAPEEMVRKVTTGEITNSAEYRAILKENQQLRTDRVNALNRADAAENHEAKAWDMVSKAQSEASAAKDRADAAKAERDAALADVQGLTEQNHQLQQRADAAEAREEEAWKMQSKAEARAKNAEDALKKQPIVGVTDPEEVRRQADALAADAKAQAQRQVEDAQRRAREAEARYQKLQQDADGFLAPEQSCAQQAKIIADSMRSMYLGWFGLASTTGTPLARMAAPIYQVCDEIRESLEEDTTINPTAEGSVEDAEREALFE